MAEALYRKYRPSRFDELVGQEHIETTLRHALEQDKLSHAYLFCGPRGTGKTTSARLLAKALLCASGPTANPDGNCEECLSIAEGTHPDVFELDAASRTGVESVREEIIANVNYAPVRGRFKIYIIDEVHMLSNAAFNALLKTLEEPPAHVIFILCTTDPHKITETIISRCQRFDFRRITGEGIVSRLAWVCKQEGASYEPEALQLLANHAQGGMRDALVLLEQLMSYSAQNITEASVNELFGLGFDSSAQDIVLAAFEGNVASLFEQLAKAQNQGVDLSELLDTMASFVRDLLVVALTSNKELCLSSRISDDLCKKFCSPEDSLRLQQAFECLMDTLTGVKKSQNTRLLFEHTCLRLSRIYAQASNQAELPVASLPAQTAPTERSLSAQVGAADRVSKARQDAHSGNEGFSARTAPSAQAGEVQAKNKPPAQEEAAPSPKPAASISSSEEILRERQKQQETAVYNAGVQIPDPVWRGLNNEAALQRLWLAVNKKTKKENQALSVMLLGAQFSFDAESKACAIHIPEGNFYTFEALQREEYVSALSAYFKECATALIPFKICIKAPSNHSDTSYEQTAHKAGTVSSSSAAAEKPKRTAPAKNSSLPESPSLSEDKSRAAIPSQEFDETPEEARVADVPTARELSDSVEDAVVKDVELKQGASLPSAGLSFLPEELRQKVANMAKDPVQGEDLSENSSNPKSDAPSEEFKSQEVLQVSESPVRKKDLSSAAGAGDALAGSYTRPSKIAPGAAKIKPVPIMGVLRSAKLTAEEANISSTKAMVSSVYSAEEGASAEHELVGESDIPAVESSLSEEELKSMVRASFGDDVVFS